MDNHVGIDRFCFEDMIGVLGLAWGMLLDEVTEVPYSVSVFLEETWTIMLVQTDFVLRI